MTNQPFDIEEWLESKKKGFSGKIPRADFVNKIKELATEIEQLKKDKTQLTTKNKELENNLTNRDQIIKDKESETSAKQKEIENLKNKLEQSEQKNNSLLENINKLQTKTEEQYKLLKTYKIKQKTKEKS